MSTTTRKTVASAHARIDALDAKLDQILAVLEAREPAKTVRAPKARKAKADPKPTKGAQTRETLSRTEWNRTLTAKARLAGKYDKGARKGTSVYAFVVAAWDQAQKSREAGMTPDEALALFL